MAGVVGTDSDEARRRGGRTLRPDAGTGKEDEPMSGEGFLGKECPWEPRGRVRETLKLLEDRERGEGAPQVCSNGRTEELCLAVIEAWDRIEELTKALKHANECAVIATAIKDEFQI
jgi:hypothetical protein